MLNSEVLVEGMLHMLGYIETWFGGLIGFSDSKIIFKIIFNPIYLFKKGWLVFKNSL